MESHKNLIIGQTVICPDGMGLIEEIGIIFCGEPKFIKVKTFIKNRGCKWSCDNIKIVPVQMETISYTLNNKTLAKQNKNLKAEIALLKSKIGIKQIDSIFDYTIDYKKENALKNEKYKVVNRFIDCHNRSAKVHKDIAADIDILYIYKKNS